VGNHDSGPVLHGGLDGFLHFLLRSLIKSRGGLIEQENFGFRDQGTGDSDSLLLSTRELATLEATLDLISLMKGSILKGLISLVNVTFNNLEVTLLGISFLKLFQDVELFVILFLTKRFAKCNFVLFHCLQETSIGVIERVKTTLVNELIAIGDSSNFNNLTILSFQLSIKDIVFDRIVENAWFLHNQRKCFSEIPNLVGLDVDSIK